jgi:hypothetical protein
MKSNTIMVGQWLFDTSARLTCLSSKQFWQILLKKRPRKLQLNQREAKDANVTTLIPDGDYLFAMEWDRKLVIQPVFKNLSSPLILGIDTIDSLGIIYLSKTKSMEFQEELHPEKFQKADVRVICIVKIQAHIGNPVKLGTTISKSPTPMPSRPRAVSTIASMELSCLFPQPGLVRPDDHGQVLITL